MSGNLLQAAKRDAKRYVTRGGFEVDIRIETPDGTQWANLTGWGTKHHINFDSDGNPINSKNVHICIDEDVLTAVNYPVRSNDEVSLRGHKITFMDSTDQDRQYVIRENLPDETLGLIVCILYDYSE